MTLFQRIKNGLLGMVLLAAGIVFILKPTEMAYLVVLTVLALSLAVLGIKDIIFYFRLARHMVGGKMILIQGVIILDFALFTATLSGVPRVFILIYLIALYAFSGVVKILRAMEARHTVAGPWKLNLVHGLVSLAIALCCLIFMKKPDTAVVIYGVGLIYSGVERILDVFRKTTFAGETFVQ